MLAHQITIAVEGVGGRSKAAEIMKVSLPSIDNYRSGRRQPRPTSLALLRQAAPDSVELAFELEMEELKEAAARSQKRQQLEEGSAHNLNWEHRVTGSSVPVYGTAAASLAGAIAIDDNVIDHIERPAGLRGAVGAYALHIIGTSMEPRFHAGDIVFVHPGRPIRAGDIVVVQTRNHEAAPVTAWLKELVSHTNDRIVTRQYNPEAEVEFTGDKVSAIHHVMTVNELFGV